jgi:hypothetical protein
MRREIRRCLGVIVVLLMAVTSSTVAAAPVRSSGLSEALVKPGAGVTFNDTYCTMNFVFRGSDGHRYVGTAGHCPLADVEDVVVYQRGKGIPAGDGSGSPIGEFIFAAYSIEKHYDFSLVRLDASVRPDPQMEHYGGPTGLNDEITTETELVNTYGQGMGVTEVVPARQLVAPHGFDDRETLFVTGLASPGDSGAPVTSEADEALGILVAGGVFLRVPDEGVPYPGVVEIARLDYNLDFAEQELGIKLRLMKARAL